jgi:hypothetical protein
MTIAPATIAVPRVPDEWFDERPIKSLRLMKITVWRLGRFGYFQRRTDYPIGRWHYGFAFVPSFRDLAWAIGRRLRKHPLARYCKLQVWYGLSISFPIVRSLKVGKTARDILNH